MNFNKSKAIVVERPRRAVVQEIRLPQVDDDSIVVKTTMSAISTGTEMKVWAGLSGHLNGELWYPLVPGYEQIGKIVHLGKNVKGFELGERVMANEVRTYPDHCAAWGGQCGYSVKRNFDPNLSFDAVARIPKEVSDEEAVFAYLAAVAKKGFDKAKPKAGENVLVIGVGLIGIAWIQLAKLAGAKVIAMDVHAGRLALAKKYADGIINASESNADELLKSLTQGKKADLIVECSGNPAVVNELPRYLRDGGWAKNDEGGRIHLQADYPAPLMFQPYQKWFTKNPTITMTCAILPGGKDEVLALISQKKLDVKSLIDSSMVKQVSVDQAGDAYQMMDASKGDLFKVLLKW